MKDLLSAQSKTYLVKLLTTGVAYLAVAYVSLVYLVPAGGTGASLVWPVAAVGAAAIFLFGYEMWPALIMPFFVLLVMRGYSPPLSLSVALGNTLESVLVAFILARLSFTPLFSRLRDTLSFIVASLTATLASSVLIAGASYFFLGSASGGFNTTLWSGLWVGHAVSLLVFGPFVFYWTNRPFFRKTRREALEGAAVFGAILALSILSSWTPYSSFSGIPLLYVLVVALIWASLRTGPRGISLALAITAITFTTGVLYGNAGVSHVPNLTQELFAIQVLVGVLAIIFLPFTSITEERKDAMRVLEGHVGQLEEALERIQTEDQAKSDFIAILAHELRNPLSPLLSGLEILKATEEGPQDILQMMGAHMDTLARLLDDLLDITRISQKKFRLQKQMVELHSVVTASLEMAQPYLASRNHTLATDIPQDEMWLSADPVRLAQVIVNLLNNAGKYTDPGGSIRLSVRHSDTMAEITVSDNGIGIAPERLGKVFEAFGGTEGHERRPGGLRIGLSLARRMAELHGGTIDVHSAGVGRGSEFVVRLPMSPSRPLPLEMPSSSRARFSKARVELDRRAQNDARLHVLVVDDNEAAAQTLSKLLERQGHRTTIAYDGPQALAAIGHDAPQAALLDIGLPGMSGYELGEKMRAQFGKHILLVALTGYGQDEDKQKAFAAGFDEHLTKPVSIVDVERVLSRR